MPEHSHSDERRKSLVTRLRRIEGQVRALQKLIAESDDCEKVAQQLAAARKALDRCFFETVACMMQQEMGEDTNRLERYTRLLAKYG